jgi:hypothetical protein
MFSFRGSMKDNAAGRYDPAANNRAGRALLIASLQFSLRHTVRSPFRHQQPPTSL